VVNTRLAVAACSVLVLAFCVPAVAGKKDEADRGDLVQRFLGCSFHWIHNDTPYSLVLVAPDSGWLISGAIRYTSVSLNQSWTPETKEKLLWHYSGMWPIEMTIKGSKFTMRWQKSLIQGTVSRFCR
jgi:hypothetical protein